MSYTNKLVQDTLCIVLSAGVRGEFVEFSWERKAIIGQR